MKLIQFNFQSLPKILWLYLLYLFLLYIFKEILYYFDKKYDNDSLSITETNHFISLFLYISESWAFFIAIFRNQINKHKKIKFRKNTILEEKYSSNFIKFKEPYGLTKGSICDVFRKFFLIFCAGFTDCLYTEILYFYVKEEIINSICFYGICFVCPIIYLIYTKHNLFIHQKVSLIFIIIISIFSLGMFKINENIDLKTFIKNIINKILFGLKASIDNYLIEKEYIDSVLIISFEGVFGTISILIYNIYLYKKENFYLIKNEDFKELKNIFILFLFLLMLYCMIVNIIRLLIIEKSSCVHYILFEYIERIILLSYNLGNSNNILFSIFLIFNSLLIFIFVFIYLELIICKFFNLDKNIISNIEKRQITDIEMIN